VSGNEFWGVIGPNGGGKSTLLKTIIGLNEPVEGKYEINHGLSFGYVPQHENYDSLF
ncbi:MAG: ATP-binding cassette domain-containing protein, partial [Phycisphaerae bacterium]|nr:ATP-binding cassette domain-containing protein [Phycisphaerae bacterium]NIU09107.1 ATP-binding cassette domain-containing protein [Phycisphaerae bacterium]NIW49170.1 ATP-binding cassette domain-containing protein [Gammaproteobacteria bacterium]NIX02270.1 ATP-binding cassette domain-containing protein [Phycisphaerae bacterium]